MVVHLILNRPNWEFKGEILVSLRINDPSGKNQEFESRDPEARGPLGQADHHLWCCLI